jgi:hypothetical protein
MRESLVVGFFPCVEFGSRQQTYTGLRGRNDLGDPKREELKVGSQRAVLVGVFHPDEGLLVKTHLMS